MNRTLASIGIAAAVICGSATPALAADNPIDAKITNISSGSSQVSSPVPSVTTPAPTPTPQSGTSTPTPNPSHSDTPSTRPTKTAEATKPSETKLAKTGTYAGVLAVLVPLIAAVGTIAYLASRKEDI